MRELTTADQASNVQSALFLAEGKVYSYVFQEIGTAGYEALKGIIPALIASLAFVTLTTAVGAGAGAAVGSLGFGVGAVPLGIAGGTLGFKAGLWILNLVGLAFLIEHMGSSLHEAVRHIESGLVRAWGPKSATDRFFSRDGDVEKAADDIALGIAVIIRCILEGVVLFLTAKGISKLPELVANLKKSKLGEGFAIWIEQNYQQLLNNPKLSGGARTGSAAAKPAKILDHSNVPEQPRPREKSYRNEVNEPANIFATIEKTSVSVKGTEISSQRILPGNKDKVLVIGRNMEAVEAYAGALRKQGVNVDTFNGPNISKAARADFKELRKLYDGRIPDDVLVQSKMYTENKAWAEIAKRKGYTVVDIGNPFGAGNSMFYDMEQSIFF